MKEFPKFLYQVFDTESGEYWSNQHGDHVWTRASNAKNSWNQAHPKLPRFNNQTQFVIHTFRPKGLGWEIVEGQMGLNFSNS